MKRLKLTPATLIFIAIGCWIPAVAQNGEPEVPQEDLYTQAELDQMLAPVALYPDVLLSQVLMAATYPLEVVEASRWTQANPTLEGNAAIEAVQDKEWDASVKALVGFPDLIQLMDENLTWTRQLGEAFLLQEEMVMETVQLLREKAMDTGSLAKMDHVTVEREATNIVIQPSNVEVVYVPYYSTRVVYGDWWWHDYPPVYWDHGPSYSSSIGFHWSRGFRVSSDFYFSTCYWPRRSVVIYDRHYHRYPDRYRDHRDKSQHRYDRYTTHWRHDPLHRRGARYKHDSLYDRYGHRRFGDREDYRKPHERRPISTLRPDRDKRPAVRERPDVANWKRPHMKPSQRPDFNRERPDFRRTPRPDPKRDRSTVVTSRPVRPKPPAARPERPAPPPPPRVVVPPPPKKDPVYAANPRSTEVNRRSSDLRRERVANTKPIRRAPIQTKDP